MNDTDLEKIIKPKKNDMTRNLKVILILWIAIGIAVSGYYYLYPVQHFVPDQILEGDFPIVNGNESGVALLVTLIGAFIMYFLSRIMNTKS